MPLAVPLVAMAQTAPTSGALLQQVPEPAQAPASTPDITLEQPIASAADDTTPFRVERIVIVGNRSFDAATLHVLVADGEGSTLTLARLDALARRITAFYRDHGFPLARAVVPAQTLDGGTVRIRVVEAVYDEVVLDNRSRIDGGLLGATLAPLEPGARVVGAQLDRSLLLLDELPGAHAQATLKPGGEVGTSTVVVAVDPGPRVEGQLTLDNAGNAYTGEVRLGAWVYLNNPLRRGDRLSLGVMTAGDDMSYGRLGYQATLNGSGTRLGAAVSTLEYSLGGSLQALQAHGTARVASAWLSQPFVRARNGALDGRLQVDRKHLHDHIDSAALKGDRHTLGWSLVLEGRHRDAHGVSAASFGLSHGKLAFDDGLAAAADAATAGLAGHYLHWNASVSRLQTLRPGTRLWVALQGQASNDNLDASEQFLLGGPGSVRGHASGALAGASGHLATVELRQELAWSDAGRTLGTVFFDAGAVRINAEPWAPGNNHVRLQSAGLGLSWAGANRWSASLQLATPVGGTSAVADDDVRAWVQVAKGF